MQSHVSIIVFNQAAELIDRFTIAAGLNDLLDFFDFSWAGEAFEYIVSPDRENEEQDDNSYVNSEIQVLYQCRLYGPAG